MRLGGEFPAGLAVDQTPPLAIPQHEMPMAARDGLAPFALPRLYLHVRHAPPVLGDGRSRVGRFGASGALIVDGKVDGFGQGRWLGLGQQLNHRRELQKRADGAAMERRQHHVADQ